MLAAAVVIAGCGGATKTVTQTSAVSQAQPKTTSTSSASSQNDQVINQASHAPDNQAQHGAAAIRKTLTQKLGLDSQLDFTISHGGGCYVKLGADAVNFEDQSENILRSPNGSDVVFVQSDTATPLVRCLKAVRQALGW